jgi:hypothetical protein
MNTPNWYKIPTGDKLRPFTFIVGGRGIGKTYSAIGEGIENHRGKFMYLRNTREQLSESCGNFGNPFKKWAGDHDRDIKLEIERRHAVINEYIEDNSDSILKYSIGVGANLSTFENLRGVDLSEIDYILFDEFIENRTLSFDQFKAFVNMYETVNRNRELTGADPCKVVLLSNAQRLGNPILRGFNLIPIIEGMQKSGQRSYANGPIRIELPFSDVSEGKRETALYQAVQGSNYTQEALNNNFVNDSFTGVKKVNINEFTPVVAIDDIYIYRHKSESYFYACGIQAKCKRFSSKDNFMIFYKLFGIKLKIAAADDKLFYSDYSTKVDLLTILNMLY